MTSFWHESWQAGRIGFHEGTPNTYLVEHLAQLPGTRVLVPMCGKTEDLAYLASQGREVIGIELVEDAVRAFFAEHAVTPAVSPRGTLVEYRAEHITIFAGDLFHVSRAEVGAIDAIYDRAALVALPADVRTRYIAHLRSLVARDTPTLLVTLDYPQDLFEGPPFAVTDAEVHAHYASAQLLGERPPTGTGRLATSGIPGFERCYRAVLRP